MTSGIDVKSIISRRKEALPSTRPDEGDVTVESGKYGYVFPQNQEERTHGGFTFACDNRKWERVKTPAILLSGLVKYICLTLL